ncbi:phosphatase PAP2 family protein [Candidatus Poriferisodalis sp.]|uniref:phosphatase PAP2 family protein n=1 Tax=Candidatus Poriferisodalis sp. TaxID=3101277 RepID=UPI003B02B17E
MDAVPMTAPLDDNDVAADPQNTPGDTLGAASGRIARFDATVDRWWDALRGQAIVDRIMYGASNVGEFSQLWHVLGAARALSPRRQVSDAFRFSALMALESLVVNQGVKRLFARRRPGTAAENPTRHPLRQPITSSFPSGHASAAFCAAAVLSRGSRLGPLYRVLATIVAVSRIHVRLHHASDVIAGALVGEIFGRIASRLMRR